MRILGKRFFRRGRGGGGKSDEVVVEKEEMKGQPHPSAAAAAAEEKEVDKTVLIPPPVNVAKKAAAASPAAEDVAAASTSIDETCEEKKNDGGGVLEAATAAAEHQGSEKEVRGDGTKRQHPQPEEEEKESEIARELYGGVVARDLVSSKWDERKEALDKMLAQIEACGGEDSDDGDSSGGASDGFVNRFTGTCKILATPMEDNVAPIVFAALNALRSLVKTSVDRVRPDDSVKVRAAVSVVIPPLLVKMGDNNRRIAREACRGLIRIARSSTIGGVGVVVSHLSDEAIPLRARLALLKLLIVEFRFVTRSSSGGGGNSDGLRLSIAMDLAMPALQIADEKTRKIAIAVVVTSYEVAGRRVLRYLAGGKAALKPAMLKILHRKFQESDAARGITHAQSGIDGDGEDGDDVAAGAVSGGSLLLVSTQEKKRLSVKEIRENHQIGRHRRQPKQNRSSSRRPRTVIGGGEDTNDGGLGGAYLPKLNHESRVSSAPSPLKIERGLGPISDHRQVNDREEADDDNNSDSNSGKDDLPRNTDSDDQFVMSKHQFMAKSIGSYGMGGNGSYWMGGSPAASPTASRVRKSDDEVVLSDAEGLFSGNMGYSHQFATTSTFEEELMNDILSSEVV